MIDKKVIVLGDKDGIPGSIIENCVKTSGADVIFNSTICYACSITGTIDDETKQEIKYMIEKYGAENIIAILGCAEVETSALTARILSTGDSDGIQYLSGAKLGIAVYHMLEPEIKTECNSTVYNKQCSMMEMVLDSNEIIKEIKSLREQYNKF
jgi:glycine/sarcosine/betaine reductase complex component A